MDTITMQFCNLIRARSQQHRSAFGLLYQGGEYGQCLGIIRQELDSLIRCVFLLSIDDLGQRNHYMAQTMNNLLWSHPETGKLITDRSMVNIADRLHGWTNSVYKLGCAFIHLSPLIDYAQGNPFSKLTLQEREDIKRHLHNQHSFDTTQELTMQSVTPYMPNVFNKINTNLEYYISPVQAQFTGGLYSL